MTYLLDHTKIGFCELDIVALLILLILVAWYLIRRHGLQKQQKDLEDQLADLYAQDSMKEEASADRK